MAKLFVIFSLVFCVSGWGQTLDAYFITIGTSSNSDFDTRINRARSQALSWIQNYYSKNQDYFKKNATDNAEVTNMIASLRDAPASKLNTSIAQNIEKCEGDILAFTSFATNPSTKSFFKLFFRFCPNSFSYSMLQLAQLFVHESYHAAEAKLNHLYRVGLGQININNTPELKEAWALGYEMGVMRDNVGCAYYNSGYFDKPDYQEAIKSLNIKELPLCHNQ